MADEPNRTSSSRSNPSVRWGWPTSIWRWTGRIRQSQSRGAKWAPLLCWVKQESKPKTTSSCT